jgi:protein TonB
MRITPRQILIALPAAVFVHAAVALIVFWEPSPAGSVAPGLGGFEVALGPAGSAPGEEVPSVPAPSEASDTDPPERPVEQPVEEVITETLEVTEPLDMAELVPEQRPDEIAAEPEELVEPEQPLEVEPEIPVEAVVVPTEVAEMVLPEKVVEAKPVPPMPPRPRLKPKPPKPKKVVVKRVKAEPPREVAKITETVEDVVEETTSTEPAAVSGKKGKSGTTESPNVGSADNTPGGGSPGVSLDYYAYLQAWLLKHKEYPRRARSRNQQGTASLYLEMDRQGRVIEFELRRSSGFRILDQEVVQLLHRAEPLPVPPPEIKGERIQFIVPINFSLR